MNPRAFLLCVTFAMGLIGFLITHRRWSMLKREQYSDIGCHSTTSSVALMEKMILWFCFMLVVMVYPLLDSIYPLIAEALFLSYIVYFSFSMFVTMSFSLTYHWAKSLDARYTVADADKQGR